MEASIVKKLQERRTPLTLGEEILRNAKHDPLDRVESFRIVDGKFVVTTVREKLLGFSDVVDAEYEVVE